MLEGWSTESCWEDTSGLTQEPREEAQAGRLVFLMRRRKSEEVLLLLHICPVVLVLR